MHKQKSPNNTYTLRILAFNRLKYTRTSCTALSRKIDFGRAPAAIGPDTGLAEAFWAREDLDTTVFPSTVSVHTSFVSLQRLSKPFFQLLRIQQNTCKRVCVRVCVLVCVRVCAELVGQSPIAEVFSKLASAGGRSAQRE
jgi:hypothetical protein